MGRMRLDRIFALRDTIIDRLAWIVCGSGIFIDCFGVDVFDAFVIFVFLHFVTFHQAIILTIFEVVLIPFDVFAFLDTLKHWFTGI
jgi:hypothetical protein